jgi:hypothetical protein
MGRAKKIATPRVEQVEDTHDECFFPPIGAMFALESAGVFDRIHLNNLGN